MAMENKRIIQLSTERLTLNGDDYVMVDSETDGSAKYRLDRLKETDSTLSVSGMAADAAATGQAISAETQARTQAVTAETQARQQAITAESQARQAADTTLGNDVDDLKSALNNSWLCLNETDIIYNRAYKSTGTSVNNWVWNAIDPSNTEFTVVLTKTKNVTKTGNLVRIQFYYTDSTDNSIYIPAVGIPFVVKADSSKTVSSIALCFYRSDSALPSAVDSEWWFVAYSGNKLSELYEISNSAKKDAILMEKLNNTNVLLNKRYENYGGSSTWWQTAQIASRQDPFHVMITDTEGVDNTAAYLLRIIVYYTDDSEGSTYIYQTNTPTLVAPNASKTVREIAFVFGRASSSVTNRFTVWNVIAWDSSKIESIDTRLTTNEETTGILARTFSKYDQIFQELGTKMPTDDGTSMFYSGVSLGHDVIKTDESGILIEINPTNIIGRVYIWEDAPSSGVNYKYLYNWTQGSWYRAYVAPNTYFSVVFRKPDQSAGLTVETVQNNCRILDPEEYMQDYIQNGIRAFEKKISDDMEDYPVMFGVITDSHYPTGDQQYGYNSHRIAIQNGCRTLCEIASRQNAFFIANLGDDAGYSDSDTDEGHIIQCMTTVDGMLRGGVHVYPVNGNHEAFQNHDGMTGTDFYRARMINLDGVTKISNVATNYYFDDEYFKIRFIFFDVEAYHRADYSQQQAYEDFSSMFVSAPSDYQFILFCHKDVGGDVDFPQATSFYTAITDYIPRLLFQCSGHTHKEGYYNSNGVHDINFMASGFFNYSGLTENGQWAFSDKESSFAIVGVNPTTKKVKVYGYGMATDRTFDFST